MNRRVGLGDASAFLDAHLEAASPGSSASSPFYAKEGDRGGVPGRQPRSRVEELHQQAADLHEAISSMDMGRGGGPLYTSIPPSFDPASSSTASYLRAAGHTAEEVASSHSTERTSPLEDEWRTAEAPGSSAAYLDPTTPTSSRMNNDNHHHHHHHHHHHRLNSHHTSSSYLETSAIGDDDLLSSSSPLHHVDDPPTPQRGSLRGKDRKWRSWLERAKVHGGGGVMGVGGGGGGPEGWMLGSSSDTSDDDGFDDVGKEGLGAGASGSLGGGTARSIFLKHLRDMSDYSLDEPPSASESRDGPAPGARRSSPSSLDAYGEGYQGQSTGYDDVPESSPYGNKNQQQRPNVPPLRSSGSAWQEQATPPPRGSTGKASWGYAASGQGGEGDADAEGVPSSPAVYEFRAKELERRLRHAESEAAAYADSLSELHSAFKSARDEAKEARACERTLRQQVERLTLENRRHGSNLAAVEDMMNEKVEEARRERDNMAQQLHGAFEEMAVRDAALADSAAYMQSLRRRNAELQVQVRSLLAQRSQQQQQQQGHAPGSGGGGSGGDGDGDASGVFALSNVKAKIEEAVGELASMSESDRKERIKALRLRWHPDKNPVLQDFATEVTKLINEAVQRLPQ